MAVPDRCRTGVGYDIKRTGKRMNGPATTADPLARISAQPGKRSGQPCIRGLRITVKDVLEYLASGMTQDEILEDFESLEPEDFTAVYAYAAQHLATASMKISPTSEKQLADLFPCLGSRKRSGIGQRSRFGHLGESESVEFRDPYEGQRLCRPCTQGRAASERNSDPGWELFIRDYFSDSARERRGYNNTHPIRRRTT